MDATAVFIQPPPAAATAGDIQICPLGGGHQSSVRLPFNASFLTVSPVGELAYARRQPDGSAVVVVGTSRNSGIAVEGDLYDLFWVDNGLLVADESSGLWLLNTHVHARQRVSFPIDPGVAVHAQDGTISFGVQRAGGTTLVVAKPTD